MLSPLLATLHQDVAWPAVLFLALLAAGPVRGLLRPHAAEGEASVPVRAAAAVFLVVAAVVIGLWLWAQSEPRA